MNRPGKYSPIPGVRLIAVTGQSRHGKDTLATFLMQAVPGAERFAFSDLLACRARLDSRMARRDPRLLQEEGGKVERGNLLTAMYYAIEDRAPKLAILTGVRKRDEVEMIRQMGGVLVRVVRTERDGRIYRATDRDLNHPVERDIDSLGEDALIAATSGDLATLERFAVAYVGDVLGVPSQVP